ncbi:MAG: alpha/beta fold hydrolase [Aquificaceae bacterium]
MKGLKRSYFEKTVLIHGWGFSSKVFKLFYGIKIDLPAHGTSTLVYRSFEKLAQDVAIRIPKGSDLIGWSMGANLALLIALNFPKRVNRLVLIGATPNFGASWPQSNVKAFLLRLRKEKESFLNDFRRKAYGEPFEDSLNLDLATKMLEDYIKLDLSSKIPFIKHNTVLLHGIHDPIVPLSSGIRLYNLLKRSKFIPFKGGHFPRYYEHLIFEILKSF